MRNFLADWGKTVVKFRWLIITVWVVLLIVSGIFATQLGSLLTGGGWGVPHSSSNHAHELISENFETRKNTSLSFVMHHEKHEIDSVEYENALKKASDFLSKEREIDRVYTWLDAPVELKESFVSDDGKATIGFVEMNIDEGFAQKVLGEIQRRLTTQLESEAFEVVILGAPAFWAQVNEHHLRKVEIRIHGLHIDISARKVYVNQQEVALRTKEFDLLLFLASHPNHVFTKSDLFERVWGLDAVGDTATVTVHVGKIRDKIELYSNSTQYIETVWGVGYRFKA